MRIAVLIVALALSGPALAADQFDLVCKGSRQIELNGPAEPTERRLHIDLKSMQYCRDECDPVQEIKSVKADKIELKYLNTDAPTMSLLVTESVDRKSGRYEYEWVQPYPVERYEKVEAVCSPAPFSGFPKTKF